MIQELRTAPRYYLLTGLTATVGTDKSELVDISLKGARLQTRRALPVGSTLPFELTTEAGTLQTPVKVLWCQMAAIALDDEEDDRYVCGVAFLEQLAMTSMIVSRLVGSGAAVVISDGRHAERFHLKAPLTAVLGRLSSVRVLDISVIGARVLTPVLLDVGAVMPLRFRIRGRDTAVDVLATVMWSRTAGRHGKFEAGLRVAEGEEWLRAVIDEMSISGGLEPDDASLRRKFDPFHGVTPPGLVEVRH